MCAEDVGGALGVGEKEERRRGIVRDMGTYKSASYGWLGHLVLRLGGCWVLGAGFDHVCILVQGVDSAWNTFLRSYVL